MDSTRLHATEGYPEQDEEPLDVLDLPQLYQKPSAQILLSTLADLSLQPLSWDRSTRNQPHQRRKISSQGIPSYLTKFISSPLAWIQDENDREQIWESASQRLSDRSGRTAMGAIERTFRIPLTTAEADEADEDDAIAAITLHEPAMTGDNLGLKTWAASFLLAKRLSALKATILPTLPTSARILELGSGTGLVGLAAAAVFPRNPVVLTDLPEIVPNIAHNLQLNAHLLQERGCEAQSAVLDWSNPTDLTLQGGSSSPHPAHTFPLILAADPIYSPDHPNLFVQAVEAHLSRERDACVVIELPLREAYVAERSDLRERLSEIGLEVVAEGEEVGYDDWSESGDGDGEELSEVRCWWGVWGWRREESG